MKRILTLLIALMPLSLAAQEDDASERLRAAEQRLEEAAREIAELSSELAAESLHHVFRTVRHPGHPGRAMLGINIGQVRKVAEDGSIDERGAARDGVEILGVTPGGPAHQAGLRSGDVILALDDRRLADDALAPEKRLMQLMDEVEPGATVRVRYRRGEAESTVSVETREFGPPHAFAFGGPGGDFEFRMENGPGMPAMPPVPEMMAQHFRGYAHFSGRGPWRGLELVPLTPKLGSYFGTDSGLLVVRAAADETIPLEEGDVIRAIAGATPTSPPEAMRLLRFYEPGDEVVIEVLRQQRNRTFEVIVPDHAEG